MIRIPTNTNTLSAGVSLDEKDSMQTTPGADALNVGELSRGEQAFSPDLESIKGAVSVGASGCPTCSVSDIPWSKALWLMAEPGCFSVNADSVIRRIMPQCILQAQD